MRDLRNATRGDPDRAGADGSVAPAPSQVNRCKAAAAAGEASAAALRALLRAAARRCRGPGLREPGTGAARAARRGRA